MGIIQYVEEFVDDLQRVYEDEPDIIYSSLGVSVSIAVVIGFLLLRLYLSGKELEEITKSKRNHQNQKSGRYFQKARQKTLFTQFVQERKMISKS